MTPKMFQDEPAEQKLAQSKKISELKNLGPGAEVAFAKVGIKTVKQFVKLGWKKSLEKLCKNNPKNCHSMWAYAMIGALQNVEMGHISESDKKQARDFCASLREKLKK